MRILTCCSVTQFYRNTFWFLVLVLCLGNGLIACRSDPSLRNYATGSYGGMRLDYPGNWNLSENERLDNLIVLESSNGFLEKNSVRLEIYWGAFTEVATNTNNLEAVMIDEIERIRLLYDLEAVSMIQEPIEIEKEDYEIIKAVISIPTTSIPKNSSSNQMNDRDPAIFQDIEIYEIINDERSRSITAIIYRGNSSELNDQALEIVKSIQ